MAEQHQLDLGGDGRVIEPSAYGFTLVGALDTSLHISHRFLFISSVHFL